MFCAGRLIEDSVEQHCLFLQPDINRLDFRSGEQWGSCPEPRGFFFCGPAALGLALPRTLLLPHIVEVIQHQGPCSDLHVRLVSWHLSCGRLLCIQRLFDVPETNLLAIVEGWHRCSIPFELRYTVRDAFCLHLYPLLNETDRLCCILYSHLPSDGGTFSISVGLYGPQWVFGSCIISFEVL